MRQGPTDRELAMISDSYARTIARVQTHTPAEWPMPDQIEAAWTEVRNMYAHFAMTALAMHDDALAATYRRYWQFADDAAQMAAGAATDARHAN